jgi:hypothetical protein
MSEVTAWNATDNANTAAPPDGWPEGQQPSSVNNCGRMMMGALRREHDRITAQIGSVAGTINTTNITAVTVNTTGAITASGPITGTALNSTGNGSVAGTLTAGGVSTGNLNASGTVTAAQLTSTGNINASGSVVAPQITSSGNINTGVLGGVYTGYVSSNGDIAAGNNISAASSLIAPNISSNSGTIHTSSQWAYDAHVYSGTHGWYYNGLVAFSWAAVYSFAYPGASDRRLKTDVEDLPDNCTALIKAISPRRFKWREGATILDHTRTHWGFVAQEVGEAFSAASLDFGGRHIGDDEAKSEALDSSEMLAVLWGAVRELTQQVEALKREKADV